MRNVTPSATCDNTHHCLYWDCVWWRHGDCKTNTDNQPTLWPHKLVCIPHNTTNKPAVVGRQTYFIKSGFVRHKSRPLWCYLNLNLNRQQGALKGWQLSGACFLKYFSKDVHDYELFESVLNPWELFHKKNYRYVHLWATTFSNQINHNVMMMQCSVPIFIMLK